MFQNKQLDNLKYELHHLRERRSPLRKTDDHPHGLLLPSDPQHELELIAAIADIENLLALPEYRSPTAGTPFDTRIRLICHSLGIPKP